MQLADHTGELGHKVIHSGNWTLLLLDSTSEPDGCGSGSLSRSELGWLQRQLAQAPQRPTLLVLHHNPAPTGSAWQDAIRLGNPTALAALVEAAPQVCGVVCGHLHQLQALSFAGRPLWSAPSTVVQFRAGREQFELETDPPRSTPGARWYRLHPDGQVDAHSLQLPQALTT
jgi:Icc protein